MYLLLIYNYVTCGINFSFLKKSAFWKSFQGVDVFNSCIQNNIYTLGQIVLKIIKFYN